MNMKKNLSLKESIFVGSMLFGLFFGAGNLIFPIFMGQMAGKNMLIAAMGFLITAVGLPLLAVVALGRSKTSGVYEMCLCVNKPFSIAFTVALYLAIGPGCAIPRCATVPFTVGVEALIGNTDSKIALLIFSFLFFATVLWFALRSSKILLYVGKILNPIFLIFLVILCGKAILKPMDNFALIEPIGAYVNQSFTTGFLEGYNTLDALAGLAFGIIVINVIKGLGVEDNDDIAHNTMISGILCCVLMALIYIGMAYVGAQSRNVLGECANGGEVFGRIAKYYFGSFGAIIFAITAVIACLKTSIGLVSSCASTFNEMFPTVMSEKKWAICFTLVSFIIANFGLSQILSWSVPFLMLIYPIAIVLIVLSIFNKVFDNNKKVYNITIFCTLIPAILDFIVCLPFKSAFVDNVASIRNGIPLGSMGLGFVTFALVGFIISLIIVKMGKKGFS